MPTKGTRQPWQIRFAYEPSDRVPEGIKGTKSFTNPESACSFGRDIIRRGGRALMVNRDTGQELTILIDGSVPAPLLDPSSAAAQCASMRARRAGDGMFLPFDRPDDR